MNRSHFILPSLRLRATTFSLAVLSLVGALSCDEPDRLPPASDGSRSRRVFRPPPDRVRPVPPHAIHKKGVGPYELGMPLQNILDLLPRGPRMVVAQIDDVLDYDVVRADDDAVIVGAARSRTREVVFVSVLDRRIARTERGVGVGTSLTRLREAMGAQAHHPSLAMDPRMLAFTSLPEARFVLDRRPDPIAVTDPDSPAKPSTPPEQGPTVAAVTVRRNRPEHAQLLAPPRAVPEAVPVKPVRPENQPGKPGAPSPPTGGNGPAAGNRAPDSSPLPAPLAEPTTGSPAPCTVEPTPADIPKLLTFGRISAEQLEQARVISGCFSAPASTLTVYEALISTESELVLVGGEAGRFRRLAVHETGDVVFATTVDIDADGRHEIAVVSQRTSTRDRERERISRIEILRYEAGRMQPLADAELYLLSTSNAAWVGASLSEIDLLLELWTDPERVQVTGLFVQWGERGQPSNVAQLMPVTVPIRRKRAPTVSDTTTEPPDNGTPEFARDAGVPDDAGPSASDGGASADESDETTPLPDKPAASQSAEQ